MLYNLITSLPLMTCALFSVLIALEWNNTQLREQRILLVFMVTATILYAGHYMFFNHAVHLAPLKDTIYVTTNLSVYPLYLIYIIRLTTTWKRTWLWLLLPAALALVTNGTLYAVMDDTQTQQFIDHYLYHNEIDQLSGLPLWHARFQNVCKCVFVVQVITTAIVGTRHIRPYDHAIERFYADTDDKSMRDIQSILYLVLAACLMATISILVGRNRFTDVCWLLAIPSVSFSVLLFAIGFLGLHRHFSIVDLERDMEAIRQVEKVSEPVAMSLAERIKETVMKEKIYLQPNLKLEDLAKMMNTNRTYIYQAINQQMGTSFNEFINCQRIAHAEQMMKAHPDMQIHDIAIRSGFASISSFYRNLRKFQSNK